MFQKQFVKQKVLKRFQLKAFRVSEQKISAGNAHAWQTKMPRRSQWERDEEGRKPVSPTLIVWSHDHAKDSTMPFVCNYQTLQTPSQIEDLRELPNQWFQFLRLNNDRWGRSRFIDQAGQAITVRTKWGGQIFPSVLIPRWLFCLRNVTNK